MSETPVLIACSHGTSNATGDAEVRGLREAVAALRPGLEVLEAYVDVQEPALPGVVAGLAEGRTAVIVPLLLSVGFHVQVDIARAAASRPGTLAAAPLGPDELLAEVLRDRLTEAGLADDDAVVLAAAGSSRPEASVAVEEVAGHLASLLGRPVRCAYGSAAEPKVPDAVAQLRAEGASRVVVASYLLAHGWFHDQLFKAGADVVAEPLLPARSLAELVLKHFDEALEAAG
ncbi:MULTISPECIES: CbiX/SirB N-terminal domain-containing protein [Arthrobacter]|uniref:CbiX/SirB N-terminal domain-containing protein n=2 Tax=Arthrobacter TaxID=1663 RepID=A0ABU9KKR0_9MICC|nr:CbiX/SirB N-terminal domain-containing protein [Arthrobacter sp. YJM1]MDP5227482.1 CbiX/SirB N-terminal domain-containing protein [Arthrobacter sp. YJM1]